MKTVHCPIVVIDRLNDLDHQRCDIFICALQSANVGCATICFADGYAYADFLTLNIPHFTLERYND